MLAFSALAPDGGTVDGFEFVRTDGGVVVTAPACVAAGVRVAWTLPPSDEPGWLVPGLLYGDGLPWEERPLYPRLTRGRADTARMESDTWSFRADRCATPAVFARGGGLVTGERSALGQAGVGLAYRDGRPTIWLDFPYREEPLAYRGFDRADPPDVQTYRWRPGERVELAFAQRDGDWRTALRPSAGLRPAAWVSVEQAAELAAHGLHRWHYKPDPARLVETRSFDTHEVRDHMHVSWVSGAPYAYALLRHGSRVGNEEYVRAAESVLDHIAGGLAPGGIFWPQWTHDRGWTWGWHPDVHRAHARTIADAARFLLRAGGRWEEAARSNLAVALRSQRDDGALAAAYHLETGEALAWEGTAGMSWIPALVAAGELDAARRAGAYYAGFEHWYGAPEDTGLAPTSEDGYAAVAAFVALEDWETARRAADWMLTFRYSYDVDFPPESTLGARGFKSLGADTASPPNQHLHAFGLVCLPELLRLGEPYATSALQQLECFRQFIARSDGDFGARTGMAAERYLQTDCFGPKGTLDPLSHAWSVGVLLLACEEVLA
ncbi:MAG TPA: hypothetical protein VFA30_01050 [Gaiellaceae bacterium]|nr:hypothetical protein [Gaiellaceae bacterium]